MLERIPSLQRFACSYLQKKRAMSAESLEWRVSGDTELLVEILLVEAAAEGHAGYVVMLLSQVNDADADDADDAALTGSKGGRQRSGLHTVAGCRSEWPH